MSSKNMRDGVFIQLQNRGEKIGKMLDKDALQKSLSLTEGKR
jgi:hypothetical protein